MLYSVIKYFERSVWNIGFIKCEPGELLEGKKKIERVQWLKHSYKDRFLPIPFFFLRQKRSWKCWWKNIFIRQAKGESFC